MHLELTQRARDWYRAAFDWRRSPGVGATLPGTPAMVVGSNGRIAWGFTNAEADTSDLVFIVGPRAGPIRGTYRPPAAPRASAQSR